MKLDVAAAARDQFSRYLARGDRDRSCDPEYCVIRELCSFIDFERYDQIKRGLLNKGTLGSEQKYLDLLYWTRSKLRIAIEQGLHRKPPLRVLDLGSGAGHFAFLCKRFGHQVTALDLGHIEVYNQLIDFFDIERIDYEIRPLVPLPPFGCRFDLVTGFMVGFNKRSKRELWGEAEWAFFLRDLARNALTPEGRLLLKMIGNRSRPGLHFDDPTFVSFVERHGGTVDTEAGYVQFGSLAAFT